jgi:hypothetical protein
MVKVIEGLFDNKGLSKKEVKKILKRKHGKKTICYVLLTCTESSSGEDLEFNLQYEGKKWMASYAMKSAIKLLKEES